MPILDPVSSGAKPSRSRWSAFVTNFHGNARWEEAIGRSQGGKRFPDAIVCNLLEESIVPFSYQSCTVQPQHLATKPWCTSCRRVCGKQRLAIYYTTGSCWGINSHPHLHQSQLFNLAPVCNSTIQTRLENYLRWHDACLKMTMMRQWLCKFSNEQKACLLIEGHCRTWKTLQEIRPRLHGRRSYGRLSQREMTLLCSPLCLLFCAHTQGTTHISRCPKRPTHPFWTVKNNLHGKWETNLKSI